MKESSPTVRVALFAGMAEAAGRRSLDVAWPGGSVAELRRAVAEAVPAVAELVAKSAVARGDRYAADDEAVAAGDELAIIPPVSGG
jgi:molybdopterin converting factor small subunit